MQMNGRFDLRCLVLRAAFWPDLVASRVIKLSWIALIASGMLDIRDSGVLMLHSRVGIRQWRFRWASRWAFG